MVTPLAFEESTLLPNAAATQYTAPPFTTAIIKKLTLTNADTAAGYGVTIYIVPAGGAAGAGNILIPARAVGPGQVVDVTEAVNQVLQPGDFISAFASTAAKVNIRISGVQLA